MSPSEITNLRRAGLLITAIFVLIWPSRAGAEENRVLRVGSELDYPPFALVDQKGRATGFTIDLLNAIAQEMGLRTDVVVGPWRRIREGFEAGELDLLPNMAISEERKRYAAFSVPHIVVHGAVFTWENAPRITSVNQIGRLRLIVMRGDIAHDYARAMGWCDESCTTTDSILEAMRLLAANRGDAVLAGRLMGLITLKDANLTGIVPQAIELPGFVQKFCIAVHKNDHELLAQINEGLLLIKQKGIYEQLYEKWLGVYELREAPNIRYWLVRGGIALGVAIALIGLAMFIHMQRALRRTVAERTAELRGLQEDYAYTLNSQMGMALRLRQEGEDCVIVQGHGTLLERLGCEPGTIDGKRLRDAFPPWIAERLSSACNRAESEGSATVDCIAPDKAVAFAASVRATTRCIVATCIEITGRIRMEEELRDAVLVAEQANRAKSEFLAHASHEIRTPLTGIIGVAEILLEEEPNAERRRHLSTLYECSTTLLQVLNDLLDLGKIESGTLQLEYGATSMHRLLDTALRLFRPLCERKGIDLRGTVQSDVPAWLWLSEKHLHQVLLNLIANAIKFTKEGFVSVGVRVASEANGTMRVRIAITDSGIGVPEELQAKLFEPFSRAHRDGLANERGTGLGLAICRQLCGLMEGTISVQSQEGQGSTFTVSLPTRPCQAPEEVSQAEIEPGGLSGLRVLVAEDNPVNQMVVTHILRQLGIEPFVVADGRAAVEASLRKQFDIALLDVQMPVMDGLSAARMIREHEGEGTRVPLIAVTAHAITHERMACLNSGMDDVLSKPLVRAQLIAMLHKWARRDQVEQTPE